MLLISELILSTKIHRTRSLQHLNILNCESDQKFKAYDIYTIQHSNIVNLYIKKKHHECKTFLALQKIESSRQLNTKTSRLWDKHNC